MKIESVRIENLRSFKDVTVPLNDYTCLVGPNGAGKSTVLYALNIFFRESINLNELSKEDFHQKDTEKPIRITVTFVDLSIEAQEAFAHYFRQGKLIVSTVVEFKEDGKVDVRQYGQRLGILDFSKFFQAADDSKIRVDTLKKIYIEIRKQYTDLPEPGSRNSMEDSLHNYEAEHKDKCELIPSEHNFYGVSGGSDRLDKYMQWVYIPAIKDPVSEQTEERNSALGKLLARTVRLKIKFDKDIEHVRSNAQEQYQKMLEENQDALDEISNNLQKRITEWAHPSVELELRWKEDSKSVNITPPSAHVQVGEPGFDGGLAYFGHGLQRSYLFALLQELAESNNVANSTMILACEEPELYQHPPQIRHLAHVLTKLSSNNSQVVICTHNPLLVSGQGFENIRMVRKDISNSHSSVSHMSYKQLSEVIGKTMGEKPSEPKDMLARIHQALQPVMNEMFFTHRLVLVEGQEDMAYVMTYLTLLKNLDEYRRIGCHIVPVGGKNQLIRPLVMAKHMRIPVYVVFDADTDKIHSDPEKDKDIKKQNMKINKAILTLSGNPHENPMPNKTFWGKGITMWHSNIGSVVKGELGKEIGKKILPIGKGLSSAWGAGKQSSELKRLCTEILNESNRVPDEA